MHTQLGIINNLMGFVGIYVWQDISWIFKLAQAHTFRNLSKGRNLFVYYKNGFRTALNKAD